MRRISASTAGAMRNATSMYGKDKAYTAGVKGARAQGSTSGMSMHKAGMRSAGLS